MEYLDGQTYMLGFPVHMLYKVPIVLTERTGFNGLKRWQANNFKLKLISEHGRLGFFKEAVFRSFIADVNCRVCVLVCRHSLTKGKC